MALMIEKIFFYFVCVLIVGMGTLQIVDSVKVAQIQLQMSQRRAVRDQQYIDIQKEITDEIQARLDHRYRDTDAASDFAKRDKKIANLESEIAKLEQK